jgi:hypothetical protein
MPPKVINREQHKVPISKRISPKSKAISKKAFSSLTHRALRQKQRNEKKVESDSETRYNEVLQEISTCCDQKNKKQKLLT